MVLTISLPKTLILHFDDGKERWFNLGEDLPYKNSSQCMLQSKTIPIRNVTSTHASISSWTGPLFSLSDVNYWVYRFEPPLLKWSAPTFRKLENLIWPLIDPTLKRLSWSCGRLKFWWGTVCRDLTQSDWSVSLNKPINVRKSRVELGSKHFSNVYFEDYSR